MKNKTLLIGLIMTITMLIVAIFGPLFAPYDPKHQIKIEYIVGKDGDGYVVSPPEPPGPNYLLGTDQNGYDILTKLLYGAKYTILLSIGIAIARVIIGGIIGMLLGFYSKEGAKKKGSSPIWSMLNGIPVFLIVWIIMIGISINPKATPFTMSIILAIVLLIIGIPSVASTIKARTLIIREKEFVTAARSLGAGGWKIIRSHLFPHMKESFLILIVQEILLILTLFGQLAIFQIFVGGTTMYPNPVEYHSRTNEWGGLIGQSRMNFYVDQYIFYVPLATYVTLIISFHLLSKGLEKRYNKLFSKFSHL
ncbi:ABC transporter permease [Paenibacillus sp. GSMTC-2017]|uniref:ABC transporter permease n=1 Tax=Paenibacillus sp. GSMTC-2017 TaxID=2794350 RepID=UPI0018D93F63|nr:ABC transporter permease subunit [Paenibacillus sp. GSMTC-2017]MBH5316204.1 ABC transporter permease [Paenibacillus sp. GSMTC-2017]